ncbi:MAG: DnaD domain protein [Clostridia bacterium]|nr:DnaD domain protein [Clostridia bacterium]
MAYSISPAVFGSMFAVPSQVVDNFIKLASASQLKTMLWIFRHASEEIDPEKISGEIGYKPADVSDALVALCEWGILMNDGKTVAVIPQPEKAEEKVEQKKELPELAVVKPTYEQVVQRCKESPEIANMFTDIQQILGKTIGYDGQCILLMIHDQYGLPFEVIYMLVNYCVSVGKSGFAYISKVGKDWGEKEIDTIEKADEQIKNLNTCSGAWKQFATMAGIQNPRPTSVQSAFLYTWTVEMKFNVEMIYMAYEEMLNHSSKISFAYMNKILTNWYSKGIKTPEDIERDKQEYRKAKSRDAKPKQDEQTSYDMDEFNRRANMLPVYKKGE